MRTLKWLSTSLLSITGGCFGIDFSSKSTNENFDNFKLGEVVQDLFDFWKKELAAIYIEAIKPVMDGNDAKKKEAALNTLYICLDSGLKMLHPPMPFITEELFHRLPHDPTTVPESICIAPFPKPNDVPEFTKENIEENMDLVIKAID